MKYAASDLKLRIVPSRSFGNEPSFMARLPSSVGIVILSIIRILLSLRIGSAGYYAKGRRPKPTQLMLRQLLLRPHRFPCSARTFRHHSCPCPGILGAACSL